MKYATVFPERFGSLAHARALMAEFVTRYNHEHHHKGVGLHTPADVHYGLAAAKADDRARVLAAAQAANPERFNTSTPPKILALPEAAWINKPEDPQPAEEPAA